MNILMNILFQLLKVKNGEDFNQRLFDYVIKEIKKDKDFEKFDFYKEDDVGMLQAIKRIRTIIEEVKFELTLEDEGTFFYDNFCGLKILN